MKFKYASKASVLFSLLDTGIQLGTSTAEQQSALVFANERNIDYVL